VKGEGEREMELGERPGTLHIHAGEARARTRRGHAASMAKKLWCMAATPSPKGTTVEQVAGTVQGVLEAVYGLELGQTRSWA
jgi:hypothetical protein